jgi:hypothetical protein
MKSGVFNEQLRMIFNQVIEPWGAPTITITPLFYQGVIAGSEFLTYNVNKVYLCESVNFMGGTSYINTSTYINLYDLTNALFVNHSSQSTYWDTVANVFRTVSESNYLYNLYFSRFLSANHGSIIFHGYRITR